ncbi:MAG: ASCH domain-containing protein [Agrobacterium cavarae]
MVAYGFKSFFAGQIENGHKRQTVRSERGRHARPGERIQLYVGLRTKHCRKIVADPLCTEVRSIEIGISSLVDEIIVSIAIDGVRLRRDDVEAFARADGFAPEYLGNSFPAKLYGRTARETMGRFWIDAHPDLSTFTGVLISWQPEVATR